jgi:hypothetical protein
MQQQQQQQGGFQQPPAIGGLAAAVRGAAAGGAAAEAAAAAAAAAAAQHHQQQLLAQGVAPAAPPGLPAPGAASAPVSIPARASASGSAGSGGLVGSAHGGSPGAALQGSAPIDIDPRKEANKVRLSLTGSLPRSSPYGTPKDLARSPLVRDPVAISALNLLPGETKVRARAAGLPLRSCMRVCVRVAVCGLLLPDRPPLGLGHASPAPVTPQPHSFPHTHPRLMRRRASCLSISRRRASSRARQCRACRRPWQQRCVAPLVLPLLLLLFEHLLLCARCVCGSART